MSPDDRNLIITLAQNVGALTEAVDNLTTEVAHVKSGMHKLQLAEARRAGHAAATRHVATQAGAAAARTETKRDRWFSRAIAFAALLISASGYVPR